MGQPLRHPVRWGAEVYRCSVLHTPDKLRGYLKVLRGDDETYPRYDELSSLLRRYGVAFGVQEDVVQQMAAQRMFDKSVNVAVGRAAVPGIAGQLEFLFDVGGSGKPRERADGGVDHRDLSFAVNVTSGTKLVRRIPPVAGKPGTDIFGRPIAVSPPPDVVLRGGSGTIVSSEDENVLLAAIDGAVCIDRYGVVEVSQTRTVHGDVDYATGNIVFSGDLTITGTVRAGFSVTATGDLVVAGSMEDGAARSSSSIEITGGAAGSGKGEIVAQGSVRVQYAENFKISAGGDIVVAEDVIHCRLQARKGIFARSIVGGEVQVGALLESETIGNSAEARTVVCVQGAAAQIARREESLRSLTRLSSAHALAREEMYTLVCRGMDAAGRLSTEHEEELAGLKVRDRETVEAIARSEETIREITAQIESAPVPVIGAATMYPNTIIRYGTAEKQIHEKRCDILITFDKDQILFNTRPWAARTQVPGAHAP